MKHNGRPVPISDLCFEPISPSVLLLCVYLPTVCSPSSVSSIGKQTHSLLHVVSPVSRILLASIFLCIIPPTTTKNINFPGISSSSANCQCFLATEIESVLNCRVSGFSRVPATKHMIVCHRATDLTFQSKADTYFKGQGHPVVFLCCFRFARMKERHFPTLLLASGMLTSIHLALAQQTTTEFLLWADTALRPNNPHLVSSREGEEGNSHGRAVCSAPEQKTRDWKLNFLKEITLEI